MILGHSPASDKIEAFEETTTCGVRDKQAAGL